MSDDEAAQEIPSGRALLRRLLCARNQNPEQSPVIDEEIREAFERTVAILALDMCGFSRLSLKYGIITYLAMIELMKDAASPAVVGNGGRVIKTDADNLFAVFDRPADALEAALDIFRAFEAVSIVLPEDRAIHGSIGIGYGETLVIDDADLFGTEMNLASKLGEDLAGKDEILLTRAAYESLPASHYRCTPAQFELPDLVISCFRFQEILRPRERPA